MFRVVAKSGLTRGVSWAITDRPISVGRAPECDIVIVDSSVSRRHCELTVLGGKIQLADLGSRNTTLVNGVPKARCELDPGDEIAVGDAVLVVVTERSETDDSFSSKTKPQSTVSVPLSRARYVHSSSADLVANSRSHTILDLIDLYQLVRALWDSERNPEVWSRLSQAIRNRFEPGHLWLASCDCAGGERVYQSGSSVGGLLHELDMDGVLDRALEEQAGHLGHWHADDGISPTTRSLMVAPIVVHARLEGFVALAASSKHPAYEENDLQLLMAMAYTAAPWLVSTELVETLRWERNQLQQSSPDAPVILGESRAIARVKQTAQRAASSDLPILIEGETGTGKELLARSIHAWSPRDKGPFVAFNCAALPNDLVDSELFGHEKGAFTGAFSRRKGMMELADNGVLFLDEVSELDPANQARLLRVLDTKTFRRLGGHSELQCDFRIISATNKPLAEEVRANRFREDLYYRLSGVVLTVPALRERTEDISLLVNHFFGIARREQNRPIRRIEPDAMRRMAAYDWPGNVRQLKLVVERCVCLASDEVIRGEDIHIADNAVGIPPMTLAEAEQRHIEHVIEICGGHVSKAARMLGISRTTLYEKLARYSSQGKYDAR